MGTSNKNIFKIETSLIFTKEKLSYVVNKLSTFLAQKLHFRHKTGNVQKFIKVTFLSFCTV